MHKLKIGIPISFDYNPLAGGSYSYTTQLINAIENYNFSKDIEIVFLNFENKDIKTHKPLITFHPFGTYSSRDLIRKALIELFKKTSINFFKKTFYRLEERHSNARNEKIKKVLDENQIKVLLYLNPDGNTYNFPFLTIHWDIGHLSTYMFPEFLEEFEGRINYYKNILPKALTIITETNSGKEELVNYTNLNPDRISVMPIFPGVIINESISFENQKELLSYYNLQSKEFFIYPAQFWAHKNHTLLIDAFEKVLVIHPHLKLVFTGSDKGNLTYIKEYIEDKKMNSKIHILGFVPNHDLYTFYKNSIGLVMPSYLGPSNMPPLEAAYLNCPVILSDIKGHRELLGDYAKYFNPTDVNELTNCLLETVDGIRNNEPFDSSIFNINNSIKCLEKILLKTIIIRKNWN